METVLGFLKWYLAPLLAAALVVSALSGCGKKAPPVPPADDARAAASRTVAG